MTWRLAFATGNAHKVDEFTRIIQGQWPGFERSWVALSSDFAVTDPIEDATSFAGNALIKARSLCAVSQLPTVADDSGLAVDVMGGAPGIFSARWCGHHGDAAANLNLLLAQLSDVAPADRAAQFICAAALVCPDGREEVRVGKLAGRLLSEPKGSGGFGYDPIFVPDGYDVTTAQMSAAEKNAISHRARAFNALLPLIRSAAGQ